MKPNSQAAIPRALPIENRSYAVCWPTLALAFGVMMAVHSLAQNPSSATSPLPGSGQLSPRAQADLQRRIADYQSKPYHLAVEDQGERWLLMEFSRQSPELHAAMWYVGAVVPPGVGGTALMYMGIETPGAR